MSPGATARGDPCPDRGPHPIRDRMWAAAIGSRARAALRARRGLQRASHGASPLQGIRATPTTIRARPVHGPACGRDRAPAHARRRCSSRRSWSSRRSIAMVSGLLRVSSISRSARRVASRGIRISVNSAAMKAVELTPMIRRGRRSAFRARAASHCVTVAVVEGDGSSSGRTVGATVRVQLAAAAHRRRPANQMHRARSSYWTVTWPCMPSARWGVQLKLYTPGFTPANDTV